MRSNGRGTRGLSRRKGTLRGQSEVLGLVLLLMITIIGVSAITAFGATVLNDVRGGATGNNAEHTMTQLDSKISLVALGTSESQEMSVTKGEDATTRIDPDAGQINVTMRNETSGEIQGVIIEDRPLGAIVYEHDDSTIAYQGGGVWKQKENGTTMISPPEFHYRTENDDEPTLTMPLVVVEGERSGGDEVRVVKNGTNPKFPVDGDETLSNPLTDSVVYITIQSEYYEAWGAFFEERTDGTLDDIDHENQTVEIKLIMEVDHESIQTALSSTSSDGELHLSGGDSRTDSYNSSDDVRFPDGYEETERLYNGTIQTGGDVTVSGGAKIHGDVKSGGVVSLEGTSEVNGTVYWSEDYKEDNPASSNGNESINRVETTSNIDALVRNTVIELSDPNDNDNDATTVIENGELNFSSNERELDTGTYYLDKLVVEENQNLTLKTSDHDEEIIIGVRNYVYIDEGNISVDGPGTVRVYVRGVDSQSGDHVALNGGDVHVPADNSTRFWLYGQSNMQVDIDKQGSNEGRFVGVIYSPTGGSGSASVEVQNGGEILGGVVTGSTEISQGGAIHYDQALRTETPVKDGREVPRVTYLHITLNEVNATSV